MHGWSVMAVVTDCEPLMVHGQHCSLILAAATAACWLLVQVGGMLPSSYHL